LAVLDEAEAQVPGELVGLLPLSTVALNVSEVIPDFDLKGCVPRDLEGAFAAMLALDVDLAIAILADPVAYAATLVALLVPYLTSGLALRALDGLLTAASLTLVLAFSVTVGASEIILLIPAFIVLHDLAKV